MTKCKNCKYHMHGECHLLPPVVIVQNPSFTGIVSFFPPVKPNDECSQGVEES